MVGLFLYQNSRNIEEFMFSLILGFIKENYKIIFVFILASVITIQNIHIHNLKSTIKSKESEVASLNIELKTSNESNKNLRDNLDLQNRQLTQLQQHQKQQQQEQKELLNIAQQEAVQKALELNDYINNKQNLTGNVCVDILGELSRIGE